MVLVGRNPVKLDDTAARIAEAGGSTETFPADVRDWDRLGELHPLWVLAVLGCETASFFCVWELQRLAFGTRDWFAMVTTQLAGNAFNRITPGGGATSLACNE